MYKRLLLLIFICTCCFAYAQPNTSQGVWRITVCDSATAQELPKATIAIGRRKYLSTDASGAASIDKNNIGVNDSIHVSFVGYKPVVFRPGTDRKFPEIIRLVALVTTLKEVKVHSVLPAGIILSGPNKGHDTHMHEDANIECAQYFPNENHLDGIITSVMFELNNDTHAIDMPFNVEILSRSSDSIYPDTALIKDSIIVRDTEKKRLFSVDVSRYHIKVPENGFFVVFQTLMPSFYSRERVWLNGRNCYQVPGINIYLNEKNNFDGKCCDIDWPPNRTGFYCLCGGNREQWKDFIKKEQWIVYADGINLGISATISPN